MTQRPYAARGTRSIIGGFTSSLPNLPVNLAIAIPFALIGLLACDSCRPTPIVDDEEPPHSGLARCEPFQIVDLVLDTGRGAPRAAATPTGAALFVQIDDEDAGVGLVELDAGLNPASLTALPELDLDGLTPGDIATSAGGLTVVALGPGHRRALLFTRRDGSPLQWVETPSLAALDRRLAVRLVTPPAAGGVQLVAHTSGTRQVAVGRLAGPILVTRNLDVPDLLLPPAATAAPGGALAIATAERMGDGRRLLRVREVGPDATPRRDALLGEVPADDRAEQIEIVADGTHYQIAWLLRGDTRSRIERVRVDVETLDVQVLPEVVAQHPDANLISFALTPSQAGVHTTWIERNDRGDWLWTSLDDGAGLTRITNLLHDRPDVRFEGPSLIHLGDALAVFWREIERDQLDGRVFAGRLDCR